MNNDLLKCQNSAYWHVPPCTFCDFQENCKPLNPNISKGFHYHYKALVILLLWQSLSWTLYLFYVISDSFVSVLLREVNSRYNVVKIFLLQNVFSKETLNIFFLAILWWKTEWVEYNTSTLLPIDRQARNVLTMNSIATPCWTQQDNKTPFLLWVGDL